MYNNEGDAPGCFRKPRWGKKQVFSPRSKLKCKLNTDSTFGIRHLLQELTTFVRDVGLVTEGYEPLGTELTPLLVEELCPEGFSLGIGHGVGVRFLMLKYNSPKSLCRIRPV